MSTTDQAYADARAAYFARLLADWPAPTPEQAQTIRRAFGLGTDAVPHRDAA